MSVSRAQVSEARRQLHPVRTELEVAAEVLVRLFDTGILQSRPHLVAQVAKAVEIPVDALRVAKSTVERRGYNPPTSASAIAGVPEATNEGRRFSNPDAARRYAAGQVKGRLKGAAATSRQPKGDEMACAGWCAQVKHVSEFDFRADAPHRRWTVCNDCRKARQRSRYLSVAKRNALNAARLCFVVKDVDEVIGLACMDCGVPLKQGDEVYGDAALHHKECP